MATNFRKELFDFPSQEFREHILTQGNNRILFSGKFGIGKTFFLNHFFQNETQQEIFKGIKFNPFHIYPINYSIANNEDIYRYIKYDVITSMLNQNIQVVENDLTYLDTLPDYIKGNLLKVLATLIYMIPKIGKDVYESYKKLEELKDDFLKHSDSIKESEGDKLINYLNTIEVKEGSIFENDIITKLISNILLRLKEESNQENILIIDDLDRIDPEHIFRLLNVFAAHLDSPSELPNKLGFDKIIIVCDINNIKNIFRAKYGSATDFNGYIDKFYSSEVFHLDNRRILKNISFESFKSVVFTSMGEPTPYYEEPNIFRHTGLARELLALFIGNGFISLRSLLNRLNFRIAIDLNKELEFDRSTSLSQVRYPLLIQFKILKDIIGSYDDIRELILRVPDQNLIVTTLNDYCEEVIYFLTIDWHRMDEGLGYKTIDISGEKIRLITEKQPRGKYLVKAYSLMEAIGEQKKTYEFSRNQFKQLMLEFLELLKRVGN